MDLGWGPGDTFLWSGGEWSENLTPVSPTLIQPCVSELRHPSVARAGTRRPAPTWAADTSGRRDVDVIATSAWER